MPMMDSAQLPELLEALYGQGGMQAHTPTAGSTVPGGMTGPQGPMAGGGAAPVMPMQQSQQQPQMPQQMPHPSMGGMRPSQGLGMGMQNMGATPPIGGMRQPSMMFPRPNMPTPGY